MSAHSKSLFNCKWMRNNYCAVFFPNSVGYALYNPAGLMATFLKSIKQGLPGKIIDQMISIFIIVFSFFIIQRMAGKNHWG